MRLKAGTAEECRELCDPRRLRAGRLTDDEAAPHPMHGNAGRSRADGGMHYAADDP